MLDADVVNKVTKFKQTPVLVTVSQESLLGPQYQYAYTMDTAFDVTTHPHLGLITASYIIEKRQKSLFGVFIFL